MTRIERLTPEQAAELPIFREEQRRLALSTDPIDHDRARVSVRALYAAAGQPEPQLVLIFTSPMLCVLARSLLRTLPAAKAQLGDQLRGQLGGQLRGQLWDQLRGQLGGQLRGQLWGQLRGQLRDQLGDQLRDQLWDQLRGQLGDQLRDQLGDQLGDQLWDQLRGQLRGQLWGQLGGQLRGQLGGQLRGQLWDQLWDQLRGQLRGQLGGQLGGQLRDQLGDQLWDQLRDQLWDQLRDQLGDQLGGRDTWQPLYFTGAWDAYWLAFYEFGRKIGARYSQRTSEHFAAYQRFARECGVSFLYPNAAFVSDRPEHMAFDAQRRLHAADGPALRYRDGYALYAWRGQRVPAEYIEQRHTRTADEVLSESNAEMRRVLMEIYADVHGPAAMLQAMGATVLDTDEMHGQPRVLLDIRGARYLRVVNGSLEPDGSRRVFLLGASPQARTPHEAVAASYARPAERFREGVRT